MQIFAVLCLAAVALARPQNGNSGVTTVTERTFTLRGEADKYYGNSNSAYSGAYNGGVSSYAAAQPSYSFETVASALPVAQSAAPAFGFQSYQAAAPAYSYNAAPAYSFNAAPAYSYNAAPALSYSAAPALSYNAAPLSYVASTPAPAVSFQAVTAAPAISYTAAPAISYNAAPAFSYNNLASTVGVRAENNFENNYETGFQNSQVSGAETKVFKHVYAFAAPEEPATRATVRVEAPVSKRKHYKLVFIKAPSSQTIVDSDITLPAQEEEKTLIYVLSKNQKQVQPEIRIKQAAASKHAKPEVFFLKYKNEAEAQAIASGAISGQNANVPAQGEIISDGSVSILGQSSGSYNSGFESGSAFDGSFRASKPLASNVVYRSGIDNAYNNGLSAVSAGSVGIVSSPVVATTAAPVALIGDAPAAFGTSSFGTNFGTNFGGSSFGSGASSFGSGASYSAFPAFQGRSNEDPASVAIKVTTESSEGVESATSSSL